jgi:hypothetical protein
MRSRVSSQPFEPTFVCGGLANIGGSRSAAFGRGPEVRTVDPELAPRGCPPHMSASTQTGEPGPALTQTIESSTA